MGNDEGNDDADTQPPSDGAGTGIKKRSRSPKDAIDPPKDIHEDIPIRRDVAPTTKEFFIQHHKHEYTESKRWIRIFKSRVQ